ncbi:MAG TPA: hypothetical protein VGM33_02770 [Baekduia sp.]|jgi:hypothetical protein
MKIRRLLAASVVLAVVVPATAEAGLPQAKSHAIAINTSVAGAVLNSSYATAHKAWGKGGVCTPDAGCEYAVKAGVATGAVASFMVEKAKVIQISLRAGTTKSGAFLFDSPLTAYKTPKGIGLGSTTAQLKRAYPQGRALAGGANYFIRGKGDRQTSFTLTKGRVTGLYMQSVKLG